MFNLLFYLSLLNLCYLVKNCPRLGRLAYRNDLSYLDLISRREHRKNHLKFYVLQENFSRIMIFFFSWLFLVIFFLVFQLFDQVWNLFFRWAGDTLVLIQYRLVSFSGWSCKKPDRLLHLISPWSLREPSGQNLVLIKLDRCFQILWGAN